MRIEATTTPRLIPAFVLILVMAACTGTKDREGATEPVAASPSAPSEVTIVAVDYAYPEAPTEIPAGLIDLTIENEGAVEHELVLSGIGDTSMDRFLEDLRGGAFGLNDQPQPEYLDQVAVPIFGLRPGSTGEATFLLTPGRYALFCGMRDVPKGDEPTPHYELGMLQELTVTQGQTEPQLPQADGTITAVDYAFDVDLRAGDRIINFINEGPDQVHQSQILAYRPGVDANDAREAFIARLDGPVPGLPSPQTIGSTGI
ncbi:MAG TPA: hypothetical protein VFK59_11065, partial [Actinomycetota bacterium]|nr:hypothetical protein [Actinomycetota bacterium]